VRTIFDPILNKLRVKDSSTSSGGTVTGSGTVNYIPKWASSTALGNSLLSDDGSNIMLGSTTTLYGGGQFKFDVSATQFVRFGSGGVAFSVQVSANNSLTLDSGYARLKATDFVQLFNPTTNSIFNLQSNGVELTEDQRIDFRTSGGGTTYFLVNPLNSRTMFGDCGLNSPLAIIEATVHSASSASDQLRLSYDTTNYLKSRTSSVGLTTIESAGSAPKINLKGALAMTTLQIGNAGLSPGDLYFDTAANALLNSDLICIRKT